MSECCFGGSTAAVTPPTHSHVSGLTLAASCQTQNITDFPQSVNRIISRMSSQRQLSSGRKTRSRTFLGDVIQTSKVFLIDHR